jgi:hypothetical protein
MATSSFDIPVTARKTTSTWGVRQFESFALKDSAGTETVHRILLVRSLEEQDGDTLTDAGISAARSAINPPLATSVSLYIWMRRHLVAIEHNSALLSGTAWRRAFLKISERGAKKLTYRSCFVLEPIPEAGTLTALLNSFTRVTRIKLKVRIPNPDLTQHTRAFFEQLKESRIREYKQDMQNRQDGLNVTEGTLARSAVALAEDGYKDGDVTFVGIRHRQVETIVFGHTAARGTLSATKEEMRRLTPNETDHVEIMVGSLIREINRIKPREDGSSKG